MLVSNLSVYAAQPKGVIVNAKPTEVTVYADRARVSRKFEKVLDKGLHFLIFDNLPSSVDENSIQITGKGLAELRDVKIVKTYVKHFSNDKITRLKSNKQKLNDKIGEINDLVEQAKAEKAFVVKITEKLTNTKQKNSKAILDPQKWVKMVSFYRKKISALDKEVRGSAIKKRELENELGRVQADIYQLGSRQTSVKRQAHVKVNVAATGVVMLNLSYIVQGPSWQPLYDLRVNSNSKSMSIIYKAIVKQSSGEDWDNVRLKLSTAKPNISGQKPTLRAWYLNVEQARVSGRAEEAPREKKKMGREADKMTYQFRNAPKDNPGRFKSLGPAKSIVSNEAGLDSLGTNAVFVIKELAQIKSDNNKHQVAIFNKTFGAEMRYSIIPKVAEHAYLKAQVKNNTSFPLLAGDANVFLDNNFVAHSRMQSVAPNEKFWTYLGIDNGIKVDYKFINKFQEKLGIFNKTKKTTYEYLISVKNNKGHSVAMHIWDQIPISRHEDIKVKLLLPEIGDKTKEIKVNKHKMIEWFYRPKSGETVKIPFKFSVENPVNKVVSSNL